jgi:hypothetical protein
LRSRRNVPRRLKVLVEQRLARPGVPIARDDLFAAAWPAERCTPASAANRLYFAIASVRSLGLRPWLLHLESGYLLDPEVPLELETPRTLLAAGMAKP